MQAVLGTVIMIALCWQFRERKPGQRFPWRVVLAGTAMQLVLAALILKTALANRLFTAINDAFVSLMNFSNEGARFLFGNTMDAPFALVAFQVLPTIIFFSSLMTIGYHSGAMVQIVRFFSRYLARWMGTSGAESLSTVGNIFLGQTEAPLMVKPFLSRATRSELHCIMVGGFGTVAGGVLAAYVGMLNKHFPDIAGHLLTASIMAAPCTVLVSKLLVPETEKPATGPEDRIEVPKLHSNVLDAAASGASDGMQLLLNVGGMLLAFIALVALANALLGWTLGLVGIQGVTLQDIFGWIFTPIAWLIGIGAGEAQEVGKLLGVKMVVNEFVAYLDLAKQLSSADALSPRAAVITAYALCGFANFSSIAIQIGGVSGMAPERRKDLAELGFRAMIGGSVVGYMTAALVGLMV
ncbi:MAG: NupC/NupG family nucleoside CNT transporter [Deltaproteobacteria bacterium]|nr:NupC/NupG family nucleoside CNT transporter [Deltaproteobacteria bacterium]